MATEEDHRSMNKRFKWSLNSSPKHDFENPLPKSGGESSYDVRNLGYDVNRNPYFQRPGSKPASSGAFVPVDKLLFTPERDFLIDNSGQKFPAAHLQDKILAILILPIHPLPAKKRTQVDRYIGVLKAAYTELHSSNFSFEVVFVADDSIGGGGDNQEYFDALFLRMPWLAIPYSDTHARSSCSEFFDSDRYVSCFLLQKDGYILHDWPAIFTIYGAKAFPFTTQRLEELEEQNLSFFTNPPSMKELLGDSVISPQGVKVPSAHLENKIVGLFFPVKGAIKKSLLSAWNKLKPNHDEFEIVVVYPPYHKYFPVNSGGPHPWFSLHDISLCQKLWWIYHPPHFFGFRSNAEQHPGVLVIIGPQDNRFCSYYAADILYKFGAEGYPFTLERAAELEKEKLMMLELNSLLGNEHLVCAADQKKVTTVSKLLGKEVVLLVSRGPWHKVRQVVLTELDINLRRGSEFPVRRISPEGCSFNEGFTQGGGFLIVHISEDGTTDVDYKAKDPVMLCPSKSAYLSCVSSGLLGFYDDSPQIAVFGQDGRLAAKLCRVEVEGESRSITPISDIDPVLLSQLHDAYYTTNLVGWSDLEHDRKVSRIDYI